MYDDKRRLITAERLKALRGEKTQQTVADDLNISKNSLVNYECCNKQAEGFEKGKGMRIEMLVALCEYYNASADYLLGLSDINSATLLNTSEST